MGERLKYVGPNKGKTRKEKLPLKEKKLPLKDFSRCVLFGNHVSIHNQPFKEEFNILITKRRIFISPFGI